jgi:hypothetical protein
MKTKNKAPILKALAYTTLLLCIGSSCQKELCDNYCCGAGTQELSYVKTVENARADIGLAGDFIIEGLINPSRPFDGEWSASLCYQQERQGIFANQLKTSYNFRKDTVRPYKYRVWGTIYNCDNCPTNAIGIAVYYIKLDKIEYQN